MLDEMASQCQKSLIQTPRSCTRWQYASRSTPELEIEVGSSWKLGLGVDHRPGFELGNLNPTSTSNLKPRAQDRAKFFQSSSGLDHGILYSIDNADLHPKPDASARSSGSSRPGSLPSSAWVNLRSPEKHSKQMFFSSSFVISFYWSLRFVSSFGECRFTQVELV